MRLPYLDPQFSGFNWSNLQGNVILIFDPTAGLSGAYRVARPSDFSSSGGGGGGDASAANQLIQIGIENNILGYIDDLERLSSGISGINQNIFAQLVSGIRTTITLNNPSGFRYPVTDLTSGASGTQTPFSFNQDNGALLAQIPNLDRTSDFVTAYPPINSSLSAGTFGARTGLGTILNANSRVLGFIQNVGVNPIFVALSGTASPTNFNFILKGGSSPLDGNGASWSFDNWYGSVSVSGSGISYTAFEY